MRAPIDWQHEGRMLAEAGRELYRSVDRGGRGVIDCGRDRLGRTVRIVRAPQWAESYPDHPQPALRLYLEIRDASGRDVTPPALNPVYVVGLPEGETPADVLTTMAHLAVTPPPDRGVR